MLLFYLPPAALVVGLLRMRRRYLSSGQEPFTDLPVRLAGQSDREKAEELWESAMDRLFIVLVGCPSLGFASLLAHTRHPLFLRLALFAVTAVAVTILGFAILRRVKESWRYSLGALGEQVVGRELDSMMLSGYRVFHDVPFGDWNVDHVAVGPNGVFAVETKTRRKSPKGKQVTFDGAALIWPGGWVDKASINQAARNAESLSKWILEATQERVTAVPVVALPGWSLGIKNFGPVAVYSAKGMAQALPRRGKDRLRDEQIGRIAFQLSQRCQLKRESASRT